MPDARVPLAGSPPGRGSKRADLSPARAFQPVRVPTGQPYGSAKQVEQMQSARPLQNLVGSPGAAPAVPSPGGSSAPTAPAASPLPSQRGPFAGGGVDPSAVLGAVSGFPTQRPGEPITTPVAPAVLGAGFKLDVLRNIARLPFAGQEIHQLVQKAFLEANAPTQPRMT